MFSDVELRSGSRPLTDDELRASGCVVCWGDACQGNFSAPLTPPSRANLVEKKDCVCAITAELIREANEAEVREYEDDITAESEGTFTVCIGFSHEPIKGVPTKEMAISIAKALWECEDAGARNACG